MKTLREKLSAVHNKLIRIDYLLSFIMRHYYRQQPSPSAVYPQIKKERRL